MSEGGGGGIGHTFGVRVQKVQRVRPAFGRLVQRVADCPSGNAYKVSVTGLTFCIIWHDKHSGDQPLRGSPLIRLRRTFHLKVKRLTMICASLALLQIMFAVHPRESVSHDSQVALLPYESCSLATPSGRQNKSLYAFL